MRGQGSLRIAAGFASATGRRTENQDFGGVDLGDERERNLQGVIAVVADGAGGPGGRTASELAVRTFIEGYRAQSILNGIGVAALKALDAYNLWLQAEAQTSQTLRGAATTFTAAILRGRTATIVHVGDSRAWLFRSNALALLTDDHVALQPDGGQRLLRAVGLEPALRLDVRPQAIEEHDRLLLTSDGVHGVLSKAQLAQLLGRRQGSEADAEAIVAAAIKAGGEDNATALVLDIIETPAPEYSTIVEAMATLPILPTPAIGDAVDGFDLVRPFAESQTARLFVARHGRGLAILKFPKPETSSEADRRRFMRETFLGQRIAHANVASALMLDEGRQTRLYLAMPFYEGETLESRLARGPMKVDEASSIGAKVGRGLTALHRAGVVHRDLKPGNIMLLADGGVKIIDLGVARLAGLDDEAEAQTPGTTDFMAPELFDRNRGDAASDQFALGVTLYRMLTGHYPYGQTLPGARPMYSPAPPVTHYRAETPAWLNAAVMRAISPKPEDRFADVQELVFQLERGRSIAAPLARPRPLLERNPTLFWQALCGLLAVLLAASLFIHLAHVAR